ncbi:MAG: AgmX/PglI C-terminal domain-containing protein [Myxococcota bacterium]
MSGTLLLLTLLAQTGAEPPPAPPTIRRLAVLEFRSQGLDGVELERLSESTRGAFIQSTGGTPFVVVGKDDVEARRAQMSGCGPGDCDLQIAKRTDAVAFVGGELVKLDGKYFLNARLYESNEGTLLISHQVTAASVEEMESGTREAAKILTWELVQLDELATLAMQPDPLPAQPEKAKVKRTVTVHEPGPEKEMAPPSWKAVAAVAAVTVPVVLAAYVLMPLIVVPGVNLVVAVVWLAHPFAAAALGWLVANKVMERRVPLMPTVLAGGLSELAACFICAGPVVLVADPLRLLAAVPFIVVMSAVNSTVVSVMVHRVGRFLTPEEPRFNLDYFNVPPSVKRVTREIDDETEAAADVVVARPPPKPYRLVSRLERKPPVEEPRTPHPAENVIPPEDGPLPDEKASGDLAGEAIVKAARAGMPAMNACYENALKRNSKLRGRMVVGFVIDEEGHVQDAHLESDELGDADLGKCVLTRFKRLEFPKPEGGAVEASFPVVFVPQGE